MALRSLAISTLCLALATAACSSDGSETTPEQPAEAFAAITEVDFTTDFLQIENTGRAISDPQTLTVCQDGACTNVELEALEVGQRLTVSGSEIGGFNSAGGEAVLFSGPTDQASSVLSYVEWGTSGHTYSALAVEASKWAEGDAVTGDFDIAIQATTAVPESSDDWFGV